MEHFKNILALWNMRHDPQAARHFAFLFWYAFMTLMGFVVIVSIGVGAYLFFGFRGHAGESLVQGGEEILTRDRIQQTVEEYDQRTLRFNSVLERGVDMPAPRR